MQRWKIPIRLQALPRHRRHLGYSISSHNALALRAEHVYSLSENANHKAHQDGSSLQNNHPLFPITESSSPYPMGMLASIRELCSLPFTTSRGLQLENIVHRMLQSQEVLQEVSLWKQAAQCAVHHLNASAAQRVVHGGPLLLEQDYEALLAGFVKARRWAAVLDVYEAVARQISNPGIALRSSQIRALAALERVDELQGVLDELRAASIQPTRSIFNILTRASLEAQQAAWTRDILHSMAEAGFAYDASTYTSILAGYRSLGPNTKVEARVYNAAESLGVLRDPHLLNALIQLRLDAEDVQASKKLLAILRHPHHHNALPRSDEIYGVHELFDACGYVSPTEDDPFPPFFSAPAQTTLSSQSSSLDSAVSPPSASPSASDNPTLVTLNIILHRSVKSGNLSLAARIYDQILESGYPPTEHTYAAVVRALTPSLVTSDKDARDGLVTAIRFVAGALYGDSASATDFAERLGILPSTSSSLTNIEVGTFRIPSDPVKGPTAHIFNALLHAILRYEVPGQPSRDLGQALSRMEVLLQIMHEMRVEPDLKTRDIFIRYLTRNNRLGVEEFQEIEDEISKPTDGAESGLNPPPLTITSSTTVRTLELQQSGLPQFPHDLFSKSTTSATPRTPLTSEMYAQLLWSTSLLSPSSSVTSARKSSHLTSAQSSPSSPSRAQAIFDHMVAQQITPKVEHYLHLMRSYANNGDMASALRVLSAALAAGILTTIAMATVIIVGYAKLGKPEVGERVFGAMQSQGAGGGGAGIKPDAASVDALARAYISAGKPADARRVILEYWHAVDKSFSLRNSKNQTQFRRALEELSLKALLYALAHLPGAQRKGGGRGAGKGSGGKAGEARRIATLGLVRRVMRTWKGEVLSAEGGPGFIPRPPIQKLNRRRVLQDRKGSGGRETGGTKPHDIPKSTIEV